MNITRMLTLKINAKSLLRQNKKNVTINPGSKYNKKS